MAKSSPASTPPPPTSGGSMYTVGALVLAALVAAMLYWKCGGEDPKPTPKPVATTPPTASEKPKLPEFAPPPPPEEDAGAEDAGAEPSASAKTPGPRRTSGGGAGVCSACGEGIPSSGLRSAVGGTAGLARGCYNRTLQQGGAEGSLTVSVSIGSNGSLCGARIANDSVGNPALSQCVLSKFKSRTYPKPEKGCVVVNVPISFKVKQ